MAFTRAILWSPGGNACRTDADGLAGIALSAVAGWAAGHAVISVGTTVRGQVYAGTMAIARLHGGPLDGQLLPLEDPELERLIVPYSETQVVYERKGTLEKTGEGDGPTEAAFWFVEAQDEIDPYSDSASDRR